jgi:hypothetical protein
VPVDAIWTATMINELESLRDFPPSATAAAAAPNASGSLRSGKPAGHCSDLYALHHGHGIPPPT